MNELEHFSLRWNNFHSNMSSGFCALLQEDALVDVTLAAEGRVLQAHKLVLSVCSPYFKQIFAANPCKHPIVILKDVHHKQLSDLLNFMYQGEVNVRQEELATFLKTAELLQIKGLTEQEPQSSPAQPHGSFRDERQILASQKPHHYQKFRQGPVRRIRHTEKPSPVVSAPDTRSSPAPSPPPSKRIRPAPSPAAVSDDNDKQDDARDTTGQEEPENDTGRVQVKSEPSSEFDNRACSNARSQEDGENAVAGKEEGVLRNAVSFQSLQTPLSPRGGPHETDESISNRTPQRLPPDLNASAASSSGLSITPSENSVPVPESEGQLRYVWSIRGTPQLVLDGYIYSLSEDFGFKKYWKCTEYIKAGCRGFCKTEGEKSATITKPHNHARCFDKIRAKEEIARRKLLTLRPLVPQYVHSRKGGLQLVLDGFLYTVHQQQGRNKYWRCVERGKLGCQGYCKTFMLEEGEVVQRLRSHNHGRQDDKIRERVNATRLRLQILHSLSQQQMGITNPYPAPSPNAS
ncbi:Modifier of mdg4 [Gryllus bimaculatus]|nr:Modifier of mdg4 [Gryllus bimaculatus]